ncbi:MAG: hypothetical protein EZS28_055221, partial [Streblomastix strix]
MLFDDIGSNADIQRFSSSLAKTITHLLSGPVIYLRQRGYCRMSFVSG